MQCAVLHPAGARHLYERADKTDWSSDALRFERIACVRHVIHASTQEQACVRVPAWSRLRDALERRRDDSGVEEAGAG